MNKDKEQHYLEVISENQELSYKFSTLERKLKLSNKLSEIYKESRDFWRALAKERSK